MVWPIGQPPGERYEAAMRSRAKWLELRDAAGLWVSECGAVHTAHEPDELAVIADFAAAAPKLGIACELLEPADAVKRFPALHSDRLHGVLSSPTELCVDPRQAIATLPKFLAEKFPTVTLRFGTTVTGIDMPRVRTATGETWTVRRAVVCGGADFETLFPAVHAQSGQTRCKLQMMATGPQPKDWRLGPHVAGGLTLAHYKSFEVAGSLAKLKARIAAQYPAYAAYGIHVMASQNELGEVVIGDSHEYDADMSIFDKADIDELILKYLRTMVNLPDWAVARRWHGVYTKHPTLPQFTAEPQPNCHLFGSPGGAGMTLAFGLAEKFATTHPVPL
jgi:FAD dependent oxidoreductase TIGR03364